VRVVATSAEGYDVLLGVEFCMPAGMVVDFGAETVHYQLGWKGQGAGRACLPARFTRGARSLPGCTRRCGCRRLQREAPWSSRRWAQRKGGGGRRFCCKHPRQRGGEAGGGGSSSTLGPRCGHTQEATRPPDAPLRSIHRPATGLAAAGMETADGDCGQPQRPVPDEGSGGVAGETSGPTRAQCGARCRAAWPSEGAHPGRGETALPQREAPPHGEGDCAAGPGDALREGARRAGSSPGAAV